MTSCFRWHLGFCKEEYTPPNRGFDSYYGYWNGAEDYFSKVAGKVGFDFHDGKDSLFDDEYAKTTYSTVKNTSCQLHQHFMSSFCADILLTKITNIS